MASISFHACLRILFYDSVSTYSKKIQVALPTFKRNLQLEFIMLLMEIHSRPDLNKFRIELMKLVSITSFLLNSGRVFSIYLNS